MISKLKTWLDRVIRDEYILEVITVVATVDTDRGLKSSTKERTTYRLKSYSKLTQKHIIAKSIEGNKIEIKTSEPFDFILTKVK